MHKQSIGMDAMLSNIFKTLEFMFIKVTNEAELLLTRHT